MRIGGLFAGYGGLEMAARAVLGGELGWVVENDPDASRVLAHHWPDVPNLGDITAVDWAQVPPVDVLTAGFPCQDISTAGRRAGIGGQRSGLWSYVVDAVGGLRPRFLLVENVAAITVRGLDVVVADLAALGMSAEWTCVRASDVGACHRRERWFLAATDPGGGTVGVQPVPVTGGGGAAVAGPDRPPAADAVVPGGWRRGCVGGEVPPGPVADADGGRREVVQRVEPGVGPWGHADRRGADGWGVYRPAIDRWAGILGRPAPNPTVDGTRGGRVLNPEFVEWMMGLPPGHVTGVPGLSRAAMLRILGNGVMPQQGAAAFAHLLPLLTSGQQA